MAAAAAPRTSCSSAAAGAGEHQPVQLVDAVSLKEGLEAARAAMLALCRRALPGWERVAGADDVQFSTVTGGISNINAKLAPAPRLGLAPVMVKVFGDKTEQIIDREAEKVVVVALGRQGFGPKVLALFANGRVEEWLNCAGLSPADMCSPAFVPRIARQLRRFHSIQVELPREPHTPWGVIRDWLAQARRLSFADAAKQAAYEDINFDALEAEVAELQAVCALTSSPLVFGHNDLLSGNILVLQEPGFDAGAPDMGGRVCFIDYEYGAYTARGYDIGNHFAEYAGFEGDYSRYPTKQQQELFFRHYLAEGHALDAAAAAPAAAASQQPAALDGAQLQALEPGCTSCLPGFLSPRSRRQSQASDAGQAPPPQEQPLPPPPQQPQQQQQQQQPEGQAEALAAQQAHRLGSAVMQLHDQEDRQPLPPVEPALLDRLSAEANVWSLASHLYWGVWAIIQACYSPIDFDYIQFSRTRLGEYYHRKTEYMADARRVFGGAAAAAAQPQPALAGAV